jgi:hypothetical protein
LLSPAYVTFHDPLLGGASGRFCEACHAALHYGADGALLDELADCHDFRVFPFLPPGY